MKNLKVEISLGLREAQRFPGCSRPDRNEERGFTGFPGLRAAGGEKLKVESGKLKVESSLGLREAQGFPG